MILVSTVTLEELCEQEKDKYDAVIASEVLEHVNDVDAFLGNMTRLIKVSVACSHATISTVCGCAS